MHAATGSLPHTSALIVWPRTPREALFRLGQSLPANRPSLGPAATHLQAAQPPTPDWALPPGRSCGGKSVQRSQACQARPRLSSTRQPAGAEEESRSEGRPACSDAERMQQPASGMQLFLLWIQSREAQAQAWQDRCSEARSVLSSSPAAPSQFQQSQRGQEANLQAGGLAARWLAAHGAATPQALPHSASLRRQAGP